VVEFGGVNTKVAAPSWSRSPTLSQARRKVKKIVGKPRTEEEEKECTRKGEGLGEKVEK